MPSSTSFNFFCSIFRPVSNARISCAGNVFTCTGRNQPIRISCAIPRASQGVTAFHFGKLDKTDFIIPAFAHFYIYIVFAAAFCAFMAADRQGLGASGTSSLWCLLSDCHSIQRRGGKVNRVATLLVRENAGVNPVAWSVPVLATDDFNAVATTSNALTSSDRLLAAPSESRAK